DPIGLVINEVELFEQTVPLLHVGDDRLSDGTSVERVTTGLADHLQRRGQPGVREDVAWFRRTAVWEKSRRRYRIAGELLLTAGPLTTDDLRDRITVSCVLDRRRHDTRHRHGSVLREELGPSVDDAGNGHC